jgi:hypothetical protein
MSVVDSVLKLITKNKKIRTHLSLQWDQDQSVKQN